MQRARRGRITAYSFSSILPTLDAGPASNAESLFGLSTDPAAESSSAIDSDIMVSRRPDTSGGALVVCPAVQTPHLGIGVIPDIPEPGPTFELPRDAVPGGGFVKRTGNPRAGLVFARANCRPSYVVEPRQAHSMKFADAPRFSDPCQAAEYKAFQPEYLADKCTPDNAPPPLGGERHHERHRVYYEPAALIRDLAKRLFQKGCIWLHAAAR